MKLFKNIPPSGNIFLLCSVVLFNNLFTGIHGEEVRCLENGRFYRNPDTPLHRIHTEAECSQYFLCLQNEVYQFKCTSGLLFDVTKQNCDFSPNVENCDLITQPSIPKPLLEKANCEEPNFWGCANGTCIPNHYFCDGSIDCLDGSDEGHCDAKSDQFLPPECDESNCNLPDCFCSKHGTIPPGNFKTSQVPQMILVTFEDAINFDNWDLYANVLFTPEILNPNGCPIKATFFVSHMYNNYQQTQKLWNYGHEIALHSITHRGPENWWAENATLVDYFDEMIGQANILHNFSSINLREIQGGRVPYLKPGGNKQFLMMKEFGLLYDSSLVAQQTDPPLWPYTLDYKIPHNCSEDQNCPTRSYPGLWEIVINKLISNKFTCTTINDCPKDLTAEEMYRMLVHNFKRHYLTNRAPYGLHFQSSWFKNPGYLAAFQQFVENMMQYPDVWFVTATQAIEWMRQPTPLGRLKSFDAWNCDRQPKPSEIACDKPNVCKLYSRVLQQQRLLYTCSECPEKFPWIGNEFGRELGNHL